jgi:hypothetical protein
MSSLAALPEVIGFFSYSREDDEGSGGRLSKLRENPQGIARSTGPQQERFSTVAGQVLNTAWRVVGK